MRRGSASIAIALALAACSKRERAAPPATPPPADAAPAPPRPPPDAAPTHSIGGLDIEPIEAKSAPPPGAPPRAIVVGGVRWADRTDPGAVYLLEIASIDRHSIAIYARSYAGTDPKLVREVKDRADACPDRNLTGFTPPTVTVTDVDGDGLAEVGFGYVLGCAGGAVVVKQLLLEGDAKYIVRGSSPDGGAPEPAAPQWPAGGLALADAAYRDNAGALDVADTVGPTTARTIYDRDDDLEAVEIARPGAVEVALSYPKLPMLARSEAGDLTTRMRAFLRVDQRWPRDRVGEQTGSCTVSLITPEVASVTCDLRVDTRTLAEQARDSGGGSVGPAVLGLTIWRTPAREPVTLVELGAPPALARCAWALDRDGVETLAGEHVDCPAARADWTELAPTTDRAKALVAAMQAP